MDKWNLVTKAVYQVTFLPKGAVPKNTILTEGDWPRIFDQYFNFSYQICVLISVLFS